MIRAMAETICLLKAHWREAKECFRTFSLPIECVCTACSRTAGWKSARNARRIGTVSISETDRGGTRAVNIITIIIVIMSQPNQNKQAG